jgi:hypothetical protein
MSKLWEKTSTLAPNASPGKSEARKLQHSPVDKMMHRASGAHGQPISAEGGLEGVWARARPRTQRTKKTRRQDRRRRAKVFVSWTDLD